MRLFVAVVPPVSVLDAIEALERPERDAIRWSRRDQWHVTLRFLGEVPDDAVDALGAALRNAALPGAREVELGPTTTALSKSVLCAPVSGLDDLASAVSAATSAWGQAPDHPRFRGHLTLARARRGNVRELAGERVHARWRVDDVTLVASRLDAAGAVYEEVLRQALPCA